MQNDIDVTLLDWLKPEKILTVDEWADNFRILSQKSSAEPGKYRTSRTPYLRQIMQDLSITSPVEEIIFMKGAQVGATEVGNNWIGYVIDHAPAPMLYVQPNIDMAKKNSKTRIDPLIEECPQLKEKVSQKKSRDSSNTILSKDFPGGTLVLAGSNSGSGLRSMPVRFLFLDEVDSYKLDVDGEGSPVKLAKARTRTFHKRKIFQASTPTIEGLSAISSAFLATDQRYYQVPCLRCGEFQKIEWHSIKWDDEGNVWFECEYCEHKMGNHEKAKLLARGVWVADVPENADPKRVGYHLSALYSPHGWYSWEEAVKDFHESKKAPELLKSFINTVLGETWKERAEKPDWGRLYDRREDYPIGTVPEGGIFLTMGVDVQRDRLEYEVVAWGRNKVSWSVEFGVLLGDTAGGEVWDKLNEKINESFEYQGRKGFAPIRLTAIDSGYNANQVYSFVRKFSPTKVIAVKGREAGMQHMVRTPQAVDVQMRGRTARHGIKVWIVGVSLIKEELYGWLRLPTPVEDEPDPIGFCHFPEYESEFFKQLTAEQMVSKVVKGYKKTEWQKTRDRNEALDCRVYARAAANVVGLDRFKDAHWKRLETDIPVHTKADAQTSEPAKTPAQPQRRRSSWL